MLVRFFVNLRWVLPFALSLGLVAWLDPTFAARDAALWVGVDIGTALGVAALVTAIHELMVRRRFA
jgi:Ethanolamine utilization protein EutJ (predicted chaperonin)